VVLVGANQYNGVIKDVKIKALTQLIGAPIEDAGSNTENRLVIIIFI
jgi:hypothetical protein